MNNTIPLHLGVFGNLYTDETARVVKEYGVERVYPNPELSLKEILFIKNNAPVDVIFPIHGKIPLVISETCFIMEHSENNDKACGFACEKSHWLSRKNGDWSLKDAGRMTLSGKDLCMIEHMNYLTEAGLEHFYIQSHGEDASYINKVGKIYRDALNRVNDKYSTLADSWIKELSVLSHEGLCNGYYFENAGQKYVGNEYHG